MNAIKLTCWRGFTLSAHLLLAVLIALGALIPQAAAHFGCNHPCCSIPAGTRMHHEPMQIAGPVHPPCCEAATSTACQLCRLEDLPRADLALSAASNQNHQSADSVFVSRNNRLPVPAMQAAGGRATAAVELHPPLLYLQTLTLLI